MAVASTIPSRAVETDRAGAARVLAAVLLAVLSVALLGATLALTVLDGESLWWIAASGAVLIPAVAGLLIAVNRPANLIGWLLLADAVNTALGSLTTPYAHYGLVASPGSLPAARWALLWSSAGWPALFAALVALVLVFPNGVLPNGRWRRVAIGAAVSFAILQIAVLFEPQNYASPYVHVTSPLPALPSVVRTVLTPFWFGAFASLFAAAWAIRVRFRRASGVERLQLLWLTYGALLIPLTIVACYAEGFVGNDSGSVTAIVTVAVLTVVPASIGLAVFRYRLFDIELVLSRTLVYSTLTVCVVAGYLALFVGFERIIPARGVAGVIAAGLVALGFQPLRHLLQHRVRRLVYGDRSDPYGALARLGQRLQAAPDPAELLTTIVDDVARALRLGYCAIALRYDSEVELAAERGRPGREPQVVLPLSHQGEETGALIVEPAPRSTLSPTDRQLLGDLARQAGIAVHGVRLMADLQRSRERLITAREEERLRLRRDLHDGIGPTLAALVFKIGGIRDSLGDSPARTDQLLEELGGNMQGAIADIRRVVYALRPPALDELGLLGAMREQAVLLAEGSGVDIAVRSADLPELPAATEVAAYRILTEALTNVARHARATRCDVDLRLTDELVLEVVDDGIGVAADVRAGVGLRSMFERAAELGGSFEVGPGAAGGTHVRVRLPVAS